MGRTATSPYRQLPTRKITFSQGVNDRLHETEIADDEVSVSTNFIQDPRNSSGIIKRPGVTKVVATDLGEIGLIGGIFEGFHDIYAATATKIRNDAGTAVATGLTSSTVASWARMRLSASSLDIFTNGTEVLKTSNGTTFSNLASGSPPAAFTQVVQFANRLWGFKNNKLYWSSLQDPDTWDSSRDSRTYASNIKALLPARRLEGKVLIVFFEDGWQWITFPNSDLLPRESFFSTEAGVAGSPSSVVDTEFGIAWWSDDGVVFSPDGRGLFRPFRDKLRGTYKGTLVTTTGWGLVHGAWNAPDGAVIFTVPVDGETLTGQIYYYPQQNAFWTCLAGQGVRMASVTPVVVSGRPTLYATRQTLISGTNDNYLYEVTGDTDDGTSISASVVTKRYDVGDQPDTLGWLSRCWLEVREVASAVTLTFDIHPNNQGFTANYVTVTLDGDPNDNPNTFPITVGWRVHRTQYRITDANAKRVPIVRLAEKVQVWS